MSAPAVEPTPDSRTMERPATPGAVVRHRGWSLVMWSVLILMIVPSGAMAIPVAPPGASAAPAASHVALPASPSVGPALGVLHPPAIPPLAGANARDEFSIDGPALAAQTQAAFFARGANPTVNAMTNVPAVKLASPSSPASSTTTPAAPLPAASTKIPTGTVTGYVNSTVTGLGLQGVGVQAYSTGSAICPVQSCAPVFSLADGSYSVTAPVGADYIQFTLAWNMTNVTYVTVYQGVSTSAHTTYLVPDGVGTGTVVANQTGYPGLGSVYVCAASRDQVVQAQPCGVTNAKGQFTVALPPLPSIVTYTPPDGYLTDFRFANATPHWESGGAVGAVVNLGTVYLTRLVHVRAELYDGVTGGAIGGGACFPFVGICRAITVCSALTNVCQNQGPSVSGNVVDALGVPGPTFIHAYAVGYVSNVVNIGNVSKLKPGAVDDVGKIYMVPMGGIYFRVGVTHNSSGVGPWGLGVWRTSETSMNGYLAGLGTLNPATYTYNTTETGTVTGGCGPGPGPGLVGVPAFPGRNDLAIVPDAVPACNPPQPLWPIPSALPVWGNETWVNVTPDMAPIVSTPGGWFNLTAGTYVYGQAGIQGLPASQMTHNYSVIALSTETNNFASYPFVRAKVNTYGGWVDTDNGWACSGHPDVITAFCLPVPPGDSKIQLGANGYPTNFTWVFGHNICCNNTIGEKAGIPLSVANLEHEKYLNLTPQGSVKGHVFRLGTNLTVAFGALQVCGAGSNVAIPGLSCFDAVVYSDGSFSTQAPLGWDYVTASASEFEPNTAWVYVNGTNVNVGNITLTPAATLDGRVVDATGHGLYEAQVKTCLLQSTNACSILGIGQTTTNGYYNGTLLGGWLPWSTYEVSASAAGYSTDWTFVNATAGVSTRAPTIVLRPVGVSATVGNMAPPAGVWVFGTLVDNSTGFGVQTNSMSACPVTGGTCSIFTYGSNSLGQFNESVLPGLYSLQIDQAGYQPVSVEINVTDVPYYNVGAIQMFAFPWVQGNITIAPWGNITVIGQQKQIYHVEMGPPSNVDACVSNRSICGLPEASSTDPRGWHSFTVMTPRGKYDYLAVVPSGPQTSTSAAGGFYTNNSIYNTSSYVTPVNVTIPLEVFSSVAGYVFDASTVNPKTGLAPWLPVTYAGVSISTFGPRHSTVNWNANGGGFYRFFVPPGANQTLLLATEPMMYTTSNATLNATQYPKPLKTMLQAGVDYNATNMTLKHFGWLDFNTTNSVTLGPAAYIGASATYFDLLNRTSYGTNSLSNGLGLLNISTMYGAGVFVVVGGTQDYNQTNFTTTANKSATSFPTANGKLPGNVLLEPWGWVRSVEVNNSSGVPYPTIVDQQKKLPLPLVTVSTQGNNPQFGFGGSQPSNWEGQFLSDSPISKLVTLTATRYGYLGNATILSIQPGQTVMKPEINLTGTGVIAGRVVGLPSYTAISGAQIQICASKGTCYYSATNASGYFWVLGVPGLDSVTATADGYVTNSSDVAQASSDTWTWLGTITLDQFAYVTGLVRALPSGLPLGGANVSLCSPLGNPVGACGFTNLTGGSGPGAGKFLLTAPAGTYVLSAGAPNFNTSYRPIALSPGQHVGVGTLFLQQYGVLKGFVYSTTTLTPVIGAKVYACQKWGGGACYQPATTDRTGAFSIGGAPGPYLLTVAAPNYADAYQGTYIVSGITRTMLPILLIPLGTDVSFPVSGFVFNATNPSQGIQGAIIAVSVGTSTAASTVANVNGAFSFPVIWGSYNLTVSAAGYAPLTRPLTVNGPVTGLDIPLYVMTYSVSGVVTDALNHQTMVGVNFFDDSQNLLATSLTDGSFSFALPNGTHVITASYSGSSTVVYPSLTFALVVNGGPLVHNLALSPASVLIHGVVVSALTGLPLAGALVTVQGIADGVPVHQQVKADSAGGFSILLPAGSYSAATSYAGYAAKTVPFSAVPPAAPVTLALSPTGVAPGSSPTSMGGLLPLVAALAALGGAMLLLGFVVLRSRRPATRQAPVPARRPAIGTSGGPR